MAENKNMSFILFIVLIFGAVILFGWWMIKWQFSEADSMLNNWAQQNQYQILEKTEANVGDGPLGRRGSDREVKYRVKIRDRNGSIKSGLIRLGSKNIGTLSEEVKVEWDD